MVVGNAVVGIVVVVIVVVAVVVIDVSGVVVVVAVIAVVVAAATASAAVVVAVAGVVVVLVVDVVVLIAVVVNVIDTVGVQLGELLHNFHALVFVFLLRLQLVLALVPLQTRVVEQLRVQFLQHFTNVNGQTVHGGVPVRHRRPFQASEHDWDDHVSILCY